MHGPNYAPPRHLTQRAPTPPHDPSPRGLSPPWQAPGLLEGQLLLARAYYLKADFDAALRCCSACSKADPSFAAAALLQAQILLKEDKVRQASAVIDQVLSHNFAVREMAQFQVIKARLHYEAEEYADAEVGRGGAEPELPGRPARARLPTARGASGGPVSSPLAAPRAPRHGLS